MKKESKHKGELSVVLSIIISIILLPITLILVLFGARKGKELLQPLIILKGFLLQSKTIFTLGLINIIIFFIVIIFQERLLEYFVMYPNDFLSGRFYTLITAGFMHASIAHLAGNLLALLLIGRIVERDFGSKKTLLIYFMSMIIAGLSSSIIFMLRGIETGSLGASGAVMGLVGIAIIYRPFEISFLAVFPLPIFILGWLYIISDITGLTNTGSMTNHIAHMAGMIGAIGIVALLMPKERVVIRKGIMTNVILVIITIITIVMVYYL